MLFDNPNPIVPIVLPYRQTKTSTDDFVSSYDVIRYDNNLVEQMFSSDHLFNHYLVALLPPRKYPGSCK